MTRKQIVICIDGIQVDQVKNLLTICADFLKKNTDAKCLIVGEKSILSMLDKDKVVVKTHLESGRFTLIHPTEQCTTDDLNDQVYFFDLASIEMLKNEKLWQATTLQNTQPIICISRLTNTSRPAFIHRIKQEISIHLKAFFTNDLEDILGSSIMSMHKSFLPRVWPYLVFCKKFPLPGIAYFAKKEGFEQTTHSIQTSGLKDSGLIRSLLFVLNLLVWALRWNTQIALRKCRSGNNLRTWNFSISKNSPLYRFLGFTIGMMMLIIIPLLSFDYGITWDEKIENEYSKDVYRYYASLGSDTACFDSRKPLYLQQIYYGTTVNLFCTVVNKWISPFEEYETRHLIISLIGVIGIIYTGRFLSFWAGGFAACLGMIFLVLSPYYFGHEMNNNKDIPFAVGYIASLFYLGKYITTFPKVSRSTIVKLILTIAFTISVRIGGLLLPFYLAMFIGTKWFMNLRTEKGGWRNNINQFVPVVIIIGLSYLLGLLFWPWALRDPLINPIKAILKFSNYTYIKSYELYEGRILFMAHKPWYYLPKYIFINTPLYIWVGIFLTILLFPFLRRLINGWIMVLLGMAIIFPLVYAIFNGSSLYNGWRHFLFIYPLIVIFSVLGWSLLLSIARNRFIRFAIFCSLFILLGRMGYWMVKNHPNEYVYFNESVGGTKGAYGNYELDYYSNSCREAAEWIVANVPSNKHLLIGTNNEPLTASYFTSKVNPNINIVWVREQERNKLGWDFAILTTRTFTKDELTNGTYPPKGTVHEIKVDGVPICVVVKRQNWDLPMGYRCIETKQYDSATYYFKRAILWDSKSEEAHRMLAVSYMNKRDYAEAEKCIDEVIKLFPESHTAYSVQGAINYYQNKCGSAIASFKKAIALNASIPDCYLHIGLCEIQNGNYFGAINVFSEAIKNQAENMEIYFNMGIAYASINDMRKAETAFLNAMKMNPSNYHPYQALAKLYHDQHRMEESAFYQQRCKALGGN